MRKPIILTNQTSFSSRFNDGLSLDRQEFVSNEQTLQNNSDLNEKKYQEAQFFAESNTIVATLNEENIVNKNTTFSSGDNDVEANFNPSGTIETDGVTYDLLVEEDEGEAIIALKGSDLSKDTVAITGVNPVQVSVKDKKIQIGLPAATMESMGLVSYDDKTIKKNNKNQLYVDAITTDQLIQGEKAFILNGGDFDFTIEQKENYHG